MMQGTLCDYDMDEITGSRPVGSMVAIINALAPAVTVTVPLRANAILMQAAVAICSVTVDGATVPDADSGIILPIDELILLPLKTFQKLIFYAVAAGEPPPPDGCILHYQFLRCFK